MLEIVNNFINGEFVEPHKKEYLDIYEPATGSVYGRVADSSSHDIKIAVKSAKDAFPSWSGLSFAERAGYLKKIAVEIKNRSNILAKYESRDTGKPITLARKVDIPRSVENFNFFANFSENFDFESSIENEFFINSVSKQALGVVGCISPWNLPLYLFTWKIAPALVVGNTVLAKPSEITPLTASKLAEICLDIGLPKGVLNIVNGSGLVAGDLIVKNKNIKAISFTGGTSTGKQIYQNSFDSFKKLSLEMGGKNPAIIFADCDYESMLKTVVKSSFTNQGQICLCSSRILVEDSIFEKFKTDFCNAISKLNIGDPIDDKTQFGSISSESQFEKIKHYINVAKNESGNILFGGNAIQLQGRCKNGWFIDPTVIEGLDNRSRLNQEEIFGPVVTLQSFQSEKEAIEIANDTQYGLSATIWTKSHKKSNRVAKNIDAGVIWINCWMVRDLRTPFGGMKDSGLGREGGESALRFFTEQKNICKPK